MALTSISDSRSNAVVSDRPERLVVEPVNGWLGHLFAPDRRERTVRDMFDVGPTGAGSNRAEHWQRIAHESDRDVHRFQEAIRAGAALVALIEPLNHAQALREQATREL